MKMQRLTAIMFGIVLFSVGSHLTAEITVKVRDLTYIDGYKSNQVMGYGLVVGLQGSGDTSKTPVAGNSLGNMLKNMGMEAGKMRSKNSAAVIVTAKLPPAVRIGDRVDVTIASIGDAKSIEGGILLQSPLKGADGTTYVVAQGPITVSKQSGGGKSIKTVATMKGGGIVEKAITPDVINNNSITLVMKEPDFTVASAIIKSVEKKYPQAKPVLVDNSKIRFVLVKDKPFAEFISDILNIEVPPATYPRVVVRERDGAIVAGGEVKITEAMVSKEGVTVEIQGSSQKVSTSYLKESASVKDLVDALNAVGASTKDIIIILKSLHDAGALHAELIIK
jgi:flagellar P-ring protein FlgI